MTVTIPKIIWKIKKASSYMNRTLCKIPRYVIIWREPAISLLAYNLWKTGDTQKKLGDVDCFPSCLKVPHVQSITHWKHDSCFWDILTKYLIILISFLWVAEATNTITRALFLKQDIQIQYHISFFKCRKDRFQKNILFNACLGNKVYIKNVLFVVSSMSHRCCMFEDTNLVIEMIYFYV